MSRDRSNIKKKQVSMEEIENFVSTVNSKNKKLKNKKGKGSTLDNSGMVEQVATLSKDLTTFNGFVYEDESGEEVFIPNLSQEMLKFQILTAYLDPSVPASSIQNAIGQWFMCESGVMTCNIRFDKITPAKINEELNFTPIECKKNYLN